MEFIQTMRELNIWSVIVRILLALIVGGMLGIGRGRKNRPAGFRTYMLVCLGSALVMMTNVYVFTVFGVSDPVRMGAQVVSGIGFLGAGTIIVTRRNQIKGITTAAGLWTAACAGLAIGVGFYEGALIGGLAIFVVMTFMQRIDNVIHGQARLMDIYLEFDKTLSFGEFLKYARDNEFDIHDVQMGQSSIGRDMEGIVLSATYPRRRSHDELLAILAKAPGVRFIDEV